ncbi:MAG: monooxygenase, partial [Xanthobacteraceae bacterium]
APHAFLADGRSTLDLFGKAYTLLVFGADSTEVASLLEAAKQRGVPMTVVALAEPQIAVLYQRKFALVRPDGHVAWRNDRMPEDALRLVDVVRGAAAVRDRRAEKPAVQRADISTKL